MDAVRARSVFALGILSSWLWGCASDAATEGFATGGAFGYGGAQNGGASGTGATANGGFAPNGGFTSTGGFSAGGGPQNTGGIANGGTSGNGGSLPTGGGGGTTGGTGGSLPTGGTSGSGGDGGSGGTGGTAPTGDWPPASDFAAKGTFATTSKGEGPACTVFRPTTLGDGGRKHPVIVWGNGTFNTPANYTDLFNHWASHGFIVAAANTSDAGSGKEMIACLEYIIQQNGTSGDYQGKVDVAHTASTGYSQGGAGCLEAGVDDRFTITAPVSPFIVLPLGGYDVASVGKQKHPMFLISGSADAVAEPTANQQPIFDQAKVPIVWATRAGATHFEVIGNGNSYRGPLTAWFRYKLMGDSAAADWFKKTPCKLCTTQGWSVKNNSLWTD